MALAQTCPGMGPMGMNMFGMGSLSINASNTIIAALPKTMELDLATSKFAMFGEILNIHLVQGPNHAVMVSYVDVRAAALATKALGGEQFCRRGPPTGDRTVTLHGDVKLDEEDITGISNIFDEEVGKSYKVEFFSLREAERVRRLTSKAEAAPEPPPGLEQVIPRPPGLQSKKAPGSGYNKQVKAPVKQQYHGLKDVTNMPTHERPQQAIMIQGLPNLLCNETCFEATLQQAGYQGSVVHFTTKTGKPTGEAIVWLNDFEAAQHIVTHFQGRKWDNASGAIVSAWRVDDQAVPFYADPWSRKKRCDTGVTEASTECPLHSEGSDSEGN